MFGLTIPWLAALISAVLPMQFRYSIEGRPYSEALWLSSLETVLFVRLLRSEGAWSGVLYCAIVIAGIYVQPFTLLIALGHLLWLVIYGRSEERWSSRVLWIVSGSVLAAILTFVPWYLRMAGIWKTISSTDGYSTQLSWRLLTNMLHDLVGGGYVCSLLVILCGAIGIILAQREERRVLMLLVCAIIAGVGGPLVADSSHGYFFAPRQMVFILPGLTILTAAGIEKLRQRWTFAALTAATALLAGSAVADIRYHMHPAEDCAQQPTAWFSRATGVPALPSFGPIPS